MGTDPLDVEAVNFMRWIYIQSNRGLPLKGRHRNERQSSLQP